MNLSRRSLIAGLLLCLPLFGIKNKNKKKRYIKFKKPDGYACIEAKNRYKCSFRVVPDEEYELVFFEKSIYEKYRMDTHLGLIIGGYMYHIVTIKCFYNYQEYEVEVNCGYLNDGEYEILEK